MFGEQTAVCSFLYFELCLQHYKDENRQEFTGHLKSVLSCLLCTAQTTMCTMGELWSKGAEKGVYPSSSQKYSFPVLTILRS